MLGCSSERFAQLLLGIVEGAVVKFAYGEPHTSVTIRTL